MFIERANKNEFVERTGSTIATALIETAMDNHIPKSGEYFNYVCRSRNMDKYALVIGRHERFSIRYEIPYFLAASIANRKLFFKALSQAPASKMFPVSISGEDHGKTLFGHLVDTMYAEEPITYNEYVIPNVAAIKTMENNFDFSKQNYLRTIPYADAYKESELIGEAKKILPSGNVISNDGTLMAYVRHDGSTKPPLIYANHWATSKLLLISTLFTEGVSPTVADIHWTPLEMLTNGDTRTLFSKPIYLTDISVKDANEYCSFWKGREKLMFCHHIKDGEKTQTFLRVNGEHGFWIKFDSKNIRQSVGVGVDVVAVTMSIDVGMLFSENVIQKGDDFCKFNFSVS